MSDKLAAETFMRVQQQRVNQYLETLLQGNNVVPQFAPLIESMNYSLLGGGKRIRPILFLATAQTFRPLTGSELPMAAALELIHSYSLIHDDLPQMDNDDLRHGKSTNHVIYGDATALLAGDALLTYAFEELSQPLNVEATIQLQMIQLLARAAGCWGMVGGQQADLSAEGQSGSRSLLETIHRHKTGKLIEAAVGMGGLYAGVSEKIQSGLDNYASHLGLLFQIVDDLLDVTGLVDEIGKKVGADEALQKLTYPRLIGLEESQKLAKAEHDLAVQSLLNAGIDSVVLSGIATFFLERKK